MHDHSCQRCSDGKPSRSKEPPREDEAPEPEPPRPSFLQRTRARLYRPMILLAIGMIPMGFVVVRLVRESLPNLAERPEYRLTVERIDVGELPPWIPADFTKSILAESGVAEEYSLLDDELVRAVSRAFEASPWVARVESVRKLATGRVEARLEFRRPVAIVRVRRVSYPIDVDGVRLPAEDLAIEAARRLPIITGIATEPAEPGRHWEDPVVRGAARIAESLAGRWDGLGLDAIRVNVAESRDHAPEDFLYELHTSGGSRILWGRAPGSDHPGELSVRQKLGKLSSYLERFESFEKPNGPYEIDIRHWRETTRQRIAAGTLDRS